MTNNKKRALFSSAIALILCCAMLVGTTFAWFTDSEASTSNVIKSGNLDVEVQYTLDGKNWADLDGAKDLFQKGLWEPGHTEVVALKIANKGTLALKYAANINVIHEEKGINVAGKEFALSDILTVTTVAQEVNQVGDILLGLVFSGSNNTDTSNVKPFKEAQSLATDQELMPGAAHYVIVTVDMPESVANEANHNGTKVPEINFGMNVLATQFTSEYDSFGNQYDKDAEMPVVVYDNAGLKAALESGASVIDAKGANVGNLNYGLSTSTVPAGKTLTIKNADFSGNGACYGNKVNGTVVFENCTFDADVYSIHFDGGSGKVVFNNCTLKGWNSFGSVEVEMNNCNISGNGKYALVRCYKDATFTNCTFDLSNCDRTDKYADRVDCGSANPTNTITLIGCTNVNGTMAEICPADIVEMGNIVIK